MTQERRRFLVLCWSLASCYFSTVSAVGKTDITTFTRDVAPILFEKCVACHHPGDIAPMSLLNYETARPWATAIREAVLTRQMPPWGADPRYGTFANNLRLSDQEIKTIVSWVDQGAKLGDPAKLPPAPSFAGGWKIGKPDLILTPAEDFVVAASGADEYVNIVVPATFDKDTWITAAEFKPGNRKVVHHAFASFVPKKPAPAAPSNPALELLSKIHFIKDGPVRHIEPNEITVNDGCATDYAQGSIGNLGWTKLSSYLPGGDPEIWPAGFAKKIPAGSEIRFTIHYSKAPGKVERDRSSLGLIFAKEPPAREVKSMHISNYLFSIPAGAADHQVRACYTLTQGIQFLTYTAHMHYRGKDMRLEAEYPEGMREVLFFVPRYDFHWQRTYRVAQPVFVPAGTRLVVTSHFDNSSNNKDNPDSTKTIRWGEPSSEEMMDGWMDYFVDETAVTSKN